MGEVYKLAVLATSLLFFAITEGSTADKPVGIYSASAAGGKSSGELSIHNTLKDFSTTTRSFASLSLENLLQYNIVIIPDCKRLPKNEVTNWIDNLRVYVTECGGSLVFFHDSVGFERSPLNWRIPLFPEVVVPQSAQRIDSYEVRVEMDPLLTSYPFLPGYKQGQIVKHMYYDHVAFTCSGGEAILTDIKIDKAVVAVGKVGKGRVVFNGTWGGRRETGEAPSLVGIDKDILLSTVKWCKAGGGLVITSVDKVKVKKWLPKVDSTISSNKIAMVYGKGHAGSHDVSVAKENITGAGISYDFIPLSFLAVRSLKKEENPLAIVFLEPRTGKGEIQTIQSYLSDGGKAIIFLPQYYSSEISKFLKMFSCKRGKGYRNTFRPDVWGRFKKIVFIDQSHLPREIEKLPRTIQDLSLVSDDSQVVAYWEDILGEIKIPAVIITKHGYLFNNNCRGDPYNYRTFVANAVIDLLPKVKDEVYKNLLVSFKKRKNEISPKVTSKAGKIYLNKAGDLERIASEAVEKENYKKANASLLQAQEGLVKAYASSMDSIKNEVRMVFTGQRGSDPEEICARLEKAGLTGIALSQVGGYYPSKLFSWQNNEKEDRMKKWIDIAHRHHLKVGPVFAPFSIYEGSNTYDKVRKENWRVVPPSSYGKTQEPLPEYIRRIQICRSHPEVTDYGIEKAVEVARNYPEVDYVFLDGIRWGDLCVCDYCRTIFQKDTGIKIEKWPDEVLGKHHDKYNDWRAGHITKVVREASRQIKKINANIKLGVFTFRGKLSSSAKGQYWWDWAEYVDFVMPMYYSPDLDGLRSLLNEINSLLPANKRAKLVPCLAVSGHRIADPLVWLKEIEIQRELAPRGIMYFAYPRLTNPNLELLEIGPFRNGAKEENR